MRRAGQFGRAAIEPCEIGTLGLGHRDTGHVGLHLVIHEIAVGLQIDEQLVQPGLPIAIGGQAGHVTHDIQRGDKTPTRRTKAVA